jgi:hypothetical protein
MPLQWANATSLGPRSYVCGYCNHSVGPNIGFMTNTAPQGQIYLCSFCGKPTFFSEGTQVPGVAYGDEVASLPDDVAKLYKEARLTMTVRAYTSAVLTCRKILMHIGVQRGAPEGKTFIEYVEYLANKGHVPPDGKGWVDKIRTKGNEANHKIQIMEKADAEDLITFLEMLLKFIYEFPAKVNASSQLPMTISTGPTTKV